LFANSAIPQLSRNRINEPCQLYTVGFGDLVGVALQQQVYSKNALILKDFSSLASLGLISIMVRCSKLNPNLWDQGCYFPGHSRPLHTCKHRQP